jgi:glycosyltransferase involved in cell wall biosynthesis
MAVYNNEKYIREAIDSILSQTLKELELIIVYDISTDKTKEVVLSYADPRIIFIENETRFGPVTSRNVGLKKARGKYIAIMDGDDISLPTRLEQQVKYMDAHPDIAISGTWSKTFGSKTGLITRHLTDPDELKAHLLFRTSLTHSSIIIRKSLVTDQGITYTDGQLSPFPEDLDLYSRASRVARLGNIPEILLLYRKHAEQSSLEKVGIQIGHTKRILTYQLSALGITPTEEELDTLISFKRYQFINDPQFFSKLGVLFNKIISANASRSLYKDSALKKIMGDVWLETAVAYSMNGKKIWKDFWHSAPRHWIQLSPRTIAKIAKIFLKGFRR